MRHMCGTRAPFGKRIRLSATNFRNFNSRMTRLSANMAVATLSTGMVGPSMGLAFWDSFAIIFIINLLSCLVPAFTATFGLTGLRMTTFS